ncbi:MAG: hypothetical protein JXR83_17935 [Deltaproteobacteria bacterium]|nr:hypothetical protein [Deltaproteobacteria bacterium]
MTNIRDRQLQSLYAGYRRQLEEQPGFELGSDGLVKLLASVGDRIGQDAGALESALSRDGITRAEQLELVRQGLDTYELADLTALLDRGEIPMTDEVRDFLSQVAGRRPLADGEVALKVTGAPADGQISGTAAPGATIEAINLSSTPSKRLHPDDTFVLGQADAQGRFSGRVPDAQEGDLIRMRSRDAAGRVSQWINVVTSGGGRDTRGAELALDRIGLEDAGDGKVKLTNINPSRPVSEPGATLKFVNERTGEEALFTMNDQGTFEDGTTLPGRAGDSFSVRASDGVNNADLGVAAGKVEVPGGAGDQHDVDLPDPALHKDELREDGTPRFSTKRYSGPLFVGSAEPADVRQGNLGDCYLPSATAALAHARPGLFEDIVRDNHDGTYTVTFKERDWSDPDRTWRDKKVTVDGDLYTRSYGGPLYGAAANSTETGEMEMWWPIFEKAYASWKGSYDRIGNGGSSARVFGEVMGRSSVTKDIEHGDAEEIWRTLKGSVDGRLPVSAGTYGSDDDGRYSNTGVYSDHSYSILGYAERDGERYVKIRNPWGRSEPYPGDGVNDGVFELKFDEFRRLYESLYTVEQE